MKKYALIIALAVVACIWVGAAKASYVPTVKITVDCGQANEHTVMVLNNENVIALYLATHPHAVLGDCPTPPQPPVITPTPVPVPTTFGPDTPTKSYLCYSHFAGSIPGSYDWNTLDYLWNAPNTTYFMPIAVKGNVSSSTGINVGNYHLICDTTGLHATGTGVNGSEGDYFDKTAWQDALTNYAPHHYNHYEIWS